MAMLKTWCIHSKYLGNPSLTNTGYVDRFLRGPFKLLFNYLPQIEKKMGFKDLFQG